MSNHQKTFIVAIIFVVSGFLVTAGLFASGIAFGQTTEKMVQTTVSAKPVAAETENKTAVNIGKTSLLAFKQAAISNSTLKNSLGWSFGKNRQNGWYLYVPLIQHTIKSDDAPESNEFAFALSKWQAENALESNGILDDATMQAFVKYWQSRRMPKVFEADETKLFRAPIVDFYDPTRDANLLNLEKETYEAYKKMIAAAAKDLNLKIENGNLVGADNFLKIVSAHRSRAYQEQLRKKEPNAGRAQLAFTSPHFTGRALDIYVGGEPVTTKDPNRALQIETKAYKWLVKNAEKFGFYPYFYEPWHWEYVPENK